MKLNEWKNKTKNNKDSYLALYKHVTDFDEGIAARYDRMTRSTYLTILAGQLYENLINEHDLNILSTELQQVVKLFAKR